MGELTTLEPVNPFQFAILIGLNRLGKHVYAGTVPAGTKGRAR